MTNKTQSRFWPDLSRLEKDPYRLSSKSPPKFRGVLHLWMVPISLAAGIWLTVRASGMGSTIVVGIYSLTIVSMFLFSSLFHLKLWGDKRWWLFRILDHTGIYLLIAGTYLAVAGLSLEGTVRIVILSATWGVIILFIFLEWLPIIPPKGLTNSLFLLVGWFSMAAVRWLWTGLGPLGFSLLLVGGVFFTYGAIVLGFRKPNPSPKYFGYHEVWHIAVVLGVTCHFLTVALAIL